MAARKRRRKEPMPGWAWMLVGLSIGLAVALVVFLHSGAPGRAPGEFLRTPGPATVSTTGRAAPEPARTEPDTESGAEARAATGADGGARTASDPAGEAVDDLEFYQLLRELEVAIPETGRSEDRAEVTPGVYQIQAGSFRTFEEADRRQARLALLGIESHVERAIVNNEIWHRVIIGPLSELDEIDRVLRRLREARIDTLPPRPVAD